MSGLLKPFRRKYEHNNQIFSKNQSQNAEREPKQPLPKNYEIFLKHRFLTLL